MPLPLPSPPLPSPPLPSHHGSIPGRLSAAAHALGAQVSSLASSVRDLIRRTRSIGSSSSSSSSSISNYLRDAPYPVAVVRQIAAVVGW